VENYNILYLGDDRSSYESGNYYTDWHESLSKIGNVTSFGPGFSTELQNLKEIKFDLIVFSHQFFDSYSFKKINYFGLNIYKYLSVPTIIFTKNEYKKMKRRLIFNWFFFRSNLIVYTKESFDKYSFISKKIYWAPFSAGKQFKDFQKNRSIDVGYRGNSHNTYIGNRRTKFVNKVEAILTDFKKDIKISENGEDFLFGENYVNWLNNSKFIINTTSAMDIVNPKFAEAMACGTITIAPEDSYEGLLEINKHYITVDKALRLLENEEEYDLFKKKYDNYSKEYLIKYNYEFLLNSILSKYLNV
jgi:hypothetical protein